MRRILVAAASVGLGLLFVLPPVGADDLSTPPDAGGSSVSAQPGFFGFQQLTTVAQGQVATGYFFAIGDEVNRIMGARSEIDGPPVNARTVAAFIQRGIGATYVYGVAGGPGGTSGALPDPPPGEAPAYAPTEPHESTFAGPVTAVVNGGQARTFDGRFHSEAKEKDGAAGAADAAAVNLDVPNYFSVQQAHITSRGQPVDTGVEAESVSVLHGLAIGPLRIDSLTSRAYGFVPSAPGDPKGEATTVVEGATVGKTPVMVTDHGVVVADKSDPSAEQQVRAALEGAGLSDVRLMNSLAGASDNKEQVKAQAGGLAIIHNDPKFGAQNPQGFRGGGFSVGGAEVNVTGKRCEPACSSPGGGSEAPGLSFSSPTPAQTGSTTPEVPSLAAASSPEAGPGATTDAASAEVPTTPEPSLTSASESVPAALGPTTTYTSDVTPQAEPATAERQLLSAGVSAGPARPARAVFAALNAMDGRDGDELGRLFLALAGAVALLVTARALCSPLIRRRNPQ
jgi:hypothetical protein